MRVFKRVLFPMVAMALILAVSACTDDADPVAPTPECVTDEDCDDGYDCVEGECVEAALECDPPCDPALCEICVDGDCVSECVGDEVCVDGECVVPALECDPPCDEDACFECQLVEGEPECVYLCDTDNCYACDGAGNCEFFCEEGEICDGAGDCIAVPECVDPNEAGFCDAVIIDSFEIVGPTFGCDFTDLSAGVSTVTGQPGVGEINNRLGGIIEEFGDLPAFGYDLEAVNAMIADQLGRARIVLLFELFGLAADGADTDWFFLNFFLGERVVADGEYFSGEAEMRVLPESLDHDGHPLMAFTDAAVSDGLLTAGPAKLAIPLPIPSSEITVPIHLDGAMIHAALGVGDHGYELSDGLLCGYLKAENVFAAINDFVAENCGCLDLDAPLIVDHEAAESCTAAGENEDCDLEDDLEDACHKLAQLCEAGVTIVMGSMDIDLDGEPATGQALSVGVHFSATSVTLID